MATPKIVADFEAQLATALAIGGTSFTLSSATDDDGVALPSGLYYFTVDNGSSSKEYFAGTLAGTSVTGVLSVSRQGAETSGAVRKHRVGASVIITDFATYMKYMNEIALVSAPDASTSAKGVVETATLAEVRARTATGGTGAKLAVTPDVMDDLPTANEKLAMAGGGYLGAPSTTNKYITQAAVPTVQTFNASGTYTKPTGLAYARVQAWGGGGSGGRNLTSAAVEAGGGGGGGYNEVYLLASQIGATETVTVGAGGAAQTVDANGNAGGNTTFGSLLTGYGGGGGGAGSTGGGGGGGGGILSAGTSAAADVAGTAGDPNTPISTNGGAGGGATLVVASMNGAGGGQGASGGLGYAGGSTVDGGGGGGGATANGTGAGGSSLRGGAGGAGSNAASGNATSGVQPGGGGGAKQNNAGSGNSGAGGDGRIVVTEFYI